MKKYYVLIAVCLTGALLLAGCAGNTGNAPEQTSESSGTATKITNLGALKIVMGFRRFLLYLALIMLFSFASGLLVNIIL